MLSTVFSCMESCELHFIKLLGRFCGRGVTLTFTGGHISLMVAFKGQNVILGLYKCNYSLTRGKELYIRSFEGNQEADVAPLVKRSLTPLT